MLSNGIYKYVLTHGPITKRDLCQAMSKDGVYKINSVRRSVNNMIRNGFLDLCPETLKLEPSDKEVMICPVCGSPTLVPFSVPNIQHHLRRFIPKEICSYACYTQYVRSNPDAVKKS